VKGPSPARLVAALPEASRAVVERLIAEAEKREVGLLLVGGPVRDRLLGREVRDVDLVVEGEGEPGAAKLARAAVPRGARTVAHERFGTVRIEVEGAVVDLASARAESYEHPGSLPEVRSGTLEEDLQRRDFTVNGLAIPLTRAASRGRPGIVDSGQGQADLAASTLRIFHPRSFHDDPTRALRAARLAPRLGFHLARGTRVALRAALRDGAFGAVSGERFRSEFEKLFTDRSLGLDPGTALRHLDDWHVLGALEPGLSLPPESRVPLRRLGRGQEPAEEVWQSGLMLWLADLEPALRRRVLRRLAVRGEPAKRIETFARKRNRWLSDLEAARGRAACDVILAPLDPTVLAALDASGAAAARRRIARWIREDRDAVVPVRGSDLVELGLEGPAIGRGLVRLRAAWLDRDVETREQLLALARELAARSLRRRKPMADKPRPDKAQRDKKRPAKKQPDKKRPSSR